MTHYLRLNWNNPIRSKSLACLDWTTIKCHNHWRTWKPAKPFWRMKLLRTLASGTKYWNWSNRSTNLSWKPTHQPKRSSAAKLLMYPTSKVQLVSSWPTNNTVESSREAKSRLRCIWDIGSTISTEKDICWTNTIAISWAAVAASDWQRQNWKNWEKQGFCMNDR